jgi:hypothetical protein
MNTLALGITCSASYVIFASEQRLTVTSDFPIVNEFADKVSTASNELISASGMCLPAKLILILKPNLMQDFSIEFVDSEANR